MKVTRKELFYWFVGYTAIMGYTIYKVGEYYLEQLLQ